MALGRLKEQCWECDIVLLAGDLFDSARIYRDTLDALKALFADIPAEIFIAPGNHDWLAQGSPYLTEQWGSNVHIFTSPEITRVHLEGLNCDVYGAAFTAPEMPPLLQDFRVENPDAVNLMVLHGDLQAASAYNPISSSDIAASGLDYLALGHVHSASVQRFGKTTCAFCGCLMGRGFDECGQKGVLRVTVSKTGCRTEPVPLAPWKYEILPVEIGENALSSILAALPENTENDCYRIVLTGECEPPALSELERALAPRFYSLSLRDRTRAKTALWAGAGEDTLRGHFLETLKEKYDRANEDEQRKIAMAARLVTALMDGREAAL